MGQQKYRGGGEGRAREREKTATHEERAQVRVPARGERAARARAAPVQALQTAGFALLVGGVVGALGVFLTRLRDGRVRLARAAVTSAVVFACAFVTQALGGYALLAGWDPLWPRWTATLADLAWRSQGTAWMFVVLFGAKIKQTPFVGHGAGEMSASIENGRPQDS